MQNHLGQPRLAAVSNFFKTQSDDELLGCYAWCQAVASGLLPILGDFEVAFRNALHQALSQHYGQRPSYDWMVLNGDTASAPAHHRLNPRSRSDINAMAGKIQGKKGRRYQVTPDDVVAALSFGFWEVLVANLDHSAHPQGLQAAVLADVFPCAPDLATCPYGTEAFRLRVTVLLARLRDARNRIGHHDAIWTVPEFDEQGGVGFNPSPAPPQRREPAITRQADLLVCGVDISCHPGLYPTDGPLVVVPGAAQSAGAGHLSA